MSEREREREIVSWTDLWKGLQKEAELGPFWNFRCFGKSTTNDFQRLRVLMAGTLCAQSWALGRPQGICKQRWSRGQGSHTQAWSGRPGF